MTTTATSLESASASRLRLNLRGGNWEFWCCRKDEILLEGPRGTGKTRTVLEFLDAVCRSIPGVVILILRRYARTLASTCLRTFNEQVLPSRGGGVAWYGGSQREPASYRYSNGSRIVVGGMDDPEKVKSSEYDIIYWNEVTEGNEADWESLKPLLRHVVNGVRLVEFRRLIGDCNPADSGNWVNQRAERGQMYRIKTTLRDNPLYYDDAGNITEEGETYLRTLTGLTGPRRERWLDGVWSGVENSCYPMFDRAVHVRPMDPFIVVKASIIWVDYGSVHRCSVGVLTIDQFNRRWVRECWGRPDTDQGKSLNLQVSQYKQRYMTSRGRVDPNQAYLAGAYGFNVAKGGGGGATGAPRLHRVDLLEPLFYNYPGGRVPSFREEKNLAVPQGPFSEPDSPGLFLVEGAPGNDELADQIEGYHYVYTETPRGRTKDVYRDNEDHVAGLEYANEEWEEGNVPPVQGGVSVRPLHAPDATKQAAQQVRTVGTRGFR